MKTENEPLRSSGRSWPGGSGGQQSRLVYLCVVVVVWQLAYMADWFLPIPDLLIAAVPIIGLLAMPVLWGSTVRKLRESARDRLMRWPTVAASTTIVLFAATASVLRGPVYSCDDRPADCPEYLEMVDSIAFDASRFEGDAPWPEYGSHNYMRVLPPLMVRGLRGFGIGVDVGFRVVSAGAYVLFAVLLLWVLLRASRDPLVATGFTLLTLGAHRVMSFPLRDVYQATDALTYPISLGLITLAVANRWRWVFVLGLVGIVTKQNLFVLSTLALIYLWFKSSGRSRRTEIAALTILSVLFYVGLSQYYHASGTVARHFVPSSGPELFDNTIGFAVREGILALFLPLVPLVLWYGREAVRFLVKHWFVGLYVVIAVAQPVLSYTTGGNLQRIAMQGVWPVYLAVALVTSVRVVPRALLWMILAYAVFMYAHSHLEDRLVLVAIMLVGSTILWARNRFASDSVAGRGALPDR